LLKRHERLVHHDKKSRGDSSLPVTNTGQTAGPNAPPRYRNESHTQPLNEVNLTQVSTPARAPFSPRHELAVQNHGMQPALGIPQAIDRLDLLSSAAAQVNSLGGLEPFHESQPLPHDEMVVLAEDSSPPVGFLGEDGDPLHDFTGFMEYVGFSISWDPIGFNVVGDPGLPTRDLLESERILRSIETNSHPSGQELHHPLVAEEVSSFSRFASRLPSLQPEARGQGDPQIGRALDDQFRRSPSPVTHRDRQQFLDNLRDFSDVMPPGFIQPSKATLSRLVSGYLNGFDGHLPFIHWPTFLVRSTAPELVLAIASVGAYYKFEQQRCIELFYASKAVAMEQVRRRDRDWASSQVSTASSNTRASIEPISTPQSRADHDRGGPTFTYSSKKEQMDTIRALLLLMAFSSWHNSLIREALSFQSTLARLVREQGLTTSEPSSGDLSWEEWVEYEADKRTKLVAYCLFNLHSIVFNVSPMILSEEMKVSLPFPPNSWSAHGASAWNQAGQNYQELAFQDAFIGLFDEGGLQLHSPVTPFGNYILIHALIQHIFFTRRISSSRPSSARSSLRPDDLSTLEQSLKRWKALWKRAPEPSRALDPQNPHGPLPFTSIALLGLAYIRLHADIGPCRSLDAQDPYQTARNLYAAPAPPRTPNLIVALLHSAHALSIPVKLGVDFVAKTQTLFWSIQHSLCSMECAFLLSKWLFSLSSPSQRLHKPLMAHEKSLLLWVHTMVDETDFAIPHQLGDEAAKLRYVLDEPQVTRRLAIAVVKIWATTFQGSSKWQIVDLIGKSLNIYGNLLEEG
jgi:hypothetical protein